MNIIKITYIHIKNDDFFAHHDERCLKMNFGIEKTNIHGSVDACSSILLIGSKEKKVSFAGDITTINIKINTQQFLFVWVWNV